MVKPGFPGDSVVKNPPPKSGDPGDVVSISQSRRFNWRRKWKPTPVFLPGKWIEDLGGELEGESREFGPAQYIFLNNQAVK